MKLKDINKQRASRIAKLVLDKPVEVEEKILDWESFARKCQIRSGRSLVPFIPYDWQREFLTQLDKHNGMVLCKTRQLGATEFIGNWLLWNAVNDPGFVAVVFSRTQSDSSDIARRVREMIVTLPHLAFETNNTKDLVVKGGGRIIFKASTPNAARGIPSVAVVVFDESAFVDGIELIYASAQPATAMLGDKAKTILMSTPNGQQGFYWEMLTEGVSPDEILSICRKIRDDEIDPIYHWSDNGWCKFFVHWKSHPVYGSDPNYLESVRIRQKLTEAQLQREYNLNFEEAVNTLYPAELVNKAGRGMYQNPMGRKYIMGIDPAFGGEDYFCLTVWDVTTMPYQLVKMYRENNKSKDYNIQSAADIINRYRPIVVGCEVNTGGRLILEDLISKLPWCRFEAVNTTESSKIMATDRLLLLLERDMIVYPSDSELKSELLAFGETITGVRRKREARYGHDDAVMSTAIAFSSYSVPIFEGSVGVVRY